MKEIFLVLPASLWKPENITSPPLMGGCFKHFSNDSPSPYLSPTPLQQVERE